MVLFYRLNDGSGFYGRLYYRDIGVNTMLDVRADINNDVRPYFLNDRQRFYVASWALSTQISAVNLSTLQTYSGYPSAARYGNVAFGSTGQVLNKTFINYDTQTYQKNVCIIEPDNYTPIDFDPARAPSLLACDALVPASRVMGTDIVDWAAFGFGATEFYVGLENGVVIDAVVDYYVLRWVFFGPGSGLTSVALNI